MRRRIFASLNFSSKVLANSYSRHLSSSPVLYQQHQQRQKNSSWNSAFGSSLAVTSVVATGIWYTLHTTKTLEAEEAVKFKNDIIDKAGTKIEGLPQYRKKEVLY